MPARSVATLQGCRTDRRFAPMWRPYPRRALRRSGTRVSFYVACEMLLFLCRSQRQQCGDVPDCTINGDQLVISSLRGDDKSVHSLAWSINLFRFSADRLASLVNEITRSGGKALAITTDVADRAQVKGLVDAAVKGLRP